MSFFSFPGSAWECILEALPPGATIEAEPLACIPRRSLGTRTDCARLGAPRSSAAAIITGLEAGAPRQKLPVHSMLLVTGPFLLCDHEIYPGLLPGKSVGVQKISEAVFRRTYYKIKELRSCLGAPASRPAMMAAALERGAPRWS